MPKLNQILAIEKQTKTNAAEQLTAIYQLLQKEPLLAGISRTYKPLSEETVNTFSGFNTLIRSRGAGYAPRGRLFPEAPWFAILLLAALPLALCAVEALR